MTVRTMPHMTDGRRLAERGRSARLVRDALNLLQSKWCVHELLAELSPISEKVLTQTLRAMERDGLIARRVHAEVPPRVEYALTPLGATMATPMKVLATWTLTNGKRVEEARDRFDVRRSSTSPRAA